MYFWKAALALLQSKISNKSIPNEPDENNFSLILEGKDQNTRETMCKRSPFGIMFKHFYDVAQTNTCTEGDDNPYHLPKFT